MGHPVGGYIFVPSSINPDKHWLTLVNELAKLDGRFGPYIWHPPEVVVSPTAAHLNLELRVTGRPDLSGFHSAAWISQSIEHLRASSRG